MPHFKKFIVFITALLLALISAGSQAQDASLLEAARAHGALNQFAALVEASGLALDSTAELTIFAPSDEAIAALPAFAIAFLGEDADLLQSVLQYHVLPGAQTSDGLSSGEFVFAQRGCPASESGR